MLDSNLSPVGGGVAAGSELDAAAGFALDLQLDQPEVVACMSSQFNPMCGPKSKIKENRFVEQSNTQQLKILLCTFPEDITGLFSNVGVRWGCHDSAMRKDLKIYSMKLTLLGLPVIIQQQMACDYSQTHVSD